MCVIACHLCAWQHPRFGRRTVGGRRVDKGCVSETGHLAPGPWALPTPRLGNFRAGESLWERGQRAPAPSPPGSQLEPQALSRGQGSAGGPPLKGQSCFPAPEPHRRVVAPGTQCPWHGRQPPHYKGPFVPTSPALKPQVTRLRWAQGLSSVSPASAGPRSAFPRGFLAQQTH